MKILSIGNSFSVDCQRYLIDVANADGFDITLGNLYIGGCSLERHFENMKSARPAYEYYHNNKSLGSASMQTALTDENWDAVTLQQASHLSGIEETYNPYITELFKYVKSKLPKAKIFINQTWAYEYNSMHPGFANYSCDRKVMHERLANAYKAAGKLLGAPVIPVGDAVSLARKHMEFDPQKGGIALTRDGFHLSYSYGRYLAALVWYSKLTGNDVRSNGFVPADYEYIGRDKDTNAPKYREIANTRADENLMNLLKEVAVHAVVTA